MDIQHIINSLDGASSRNPKVEQGQVPAIVAGAKNTSTGGASDALDIDRELQKRIAQLKELALNAPDVRKEKVAKLRDELETQTREHHVFRETAEAMLRGEVLNLSELDLEELR